MEKGLYLTRGSPWVQTHKLLLLVIKSEGEREREKMRGQSQGWRRGEGGGEALEEAGQRRRNEDKKKE